MAGEWQGSEQLVRAWLLLLHLDLWRTWNVEPGNPFEGLVELDRVALMGHSRGGEAASVAASLAGAASAPRSGMAPWPTGFHVRAAVAIAPSDGQFGTPVYLRGTDLLELGAGYDSDARGWMGLRQYARTTVADGGFKAAFWSYRSNHGQFNTVWGRSDHGVLGGAILNLEPILPAAEQQDVAKTVISAFLEASLNRIDRYRGLFRRPMVGRDWLPADDIYLVRSMDDGFVPLTTGNPAQPVARVTVATAGFEAVRSVNLPLRAFQMDQGTRGLQLRWSASAGTATWSLGGIGAVVRVADATTLRIALANGSERRQARLQRCHSIR